MRLHKIALWVFITILISGIMFGFGFLSDVNRLGGWDNLVLGIGSQYNISDSDSADLSDIERIEISVSSSDTAIFPSENGKINALFSGNVRTTNPGSVPHLEMVRSGKVLYIREVRQSNITIGFYSSNVNLSVSIPEEFKDNLVFNGSSSSLKAEKLTLDSFKLRVSSGDIELGNIAVSSDFSVKTSSGKVNISDITADEAYVECSSGDKYIKSIKTNKNITLKSGSGKVIIDNLECNNAIIEASSGDIHLGRAVTAQISTKTSSGSQKFDSFEGDAHLTSSSGDVTLRSQKPDKEINISTSSGRIGLYLPQDASFSVSARTGSGDIDTQFELNDSHKEKRELRGKAGSGLINIILKSSSGDIDINKL